MFGLKRKNRKTVETKLTAADHALAELEEHQRWLDNFTAENEGSWLELRRHFAENHIARNVLFTMRGDRQ